MKILYVIRHCKASGQEISAPLTDEGVKQSIQLAEFLNEYPIKYIISSPYVRAIESIKPYAQKRQLPVHEDERLGERILSKGPVPNWEELLKASFEDETAALEDGESSKQATERVQALINDMMKLDYEHVALVSHGNLTTLLLRIFDESYGFDEWKAMENPDVYMVGIKEDTSTVQKIWNKKQG